MGPDHPPRPAYAGVVGRARRSQLGNVHLGRGEYEIVSLFEGYWVDTSDTYAGDPEIGILWAYLPEPPEDEK